MARYRISEAAREDLERVYRHGVRECGEAQADRYFDALFDRFEDLVDRPYGYPAVEEIRTGYRGSVCSADNIYYRVVDRTVEIMRILGRQDVGEWL